MKQFHVWTTTKVLVADSYAPLSGKQMPPTLSIDFDGVLHKFTKGWQDGHIYDEPVAGAIGALLRLYDAGWRIVISTCRHDPEGIRDWIIKHLPSGATIEFEITNEKVVANYYIDDHAVPFDGWTKTMCAIGLPTPFKPNSVKHEEKE